VRTMETVVGLLILVAPFAILYAITRTDESVADLVDRWGPTSAALICGVASFFALPVIGAVVLAALFAYFGLVRALYEWGALAMRMIALGGVGVWITTVYLFPHGLANLRELAFALDTVDETADEDEFAALDRDAEPFATPPARDSRLEPSAPRSSTPSTTTKPLPPPRSFGSEFIDLLAANPGSLPWKLTGPEAAALRRPAPDDTGTTRLPEPEEKEDSSEHDVAAVHRGLNRERSPVGNERPARTRLRTSALDLYRQGKVPNTYAAMLTVWGEALQALDQEVLAELTHPNARGILRGIVSKTIDKVTLEGLRARYANARHERWLRRSDNEYVAVVRVGGVFGPRVQFVCRLYQRRWRLYQIKDSGLAEFLRSYKLQAETPLRPTEPNTTEQDENKTSGDSTDQQMDEARVNE